MEFGKYKIIRYKIMQWKLKNKNVIYPKESLFFLQKMFCFF